MKPITKVSDSVGKKYPQAASLQIGEPTGSSITGILTGRIQARPNSRVSGFFKTYVEVRLEDGRTKYLRLGGTVKEMEDLIGIENLIGYAVTGVVKSFADDSGKEVRYVDELDPSTELKNAVNAFFSNQQQGQNQNQNQGQNQGQNQILQQNLFP